MATIRITFVWGLLEGAYRLPETEAPLPKIPVQPIGYDEAEILLRWALTYLTFQRICIYYSPFFFVQVDVNRQSCSGRLAGWSEYNVLFGFKIHSTEMDCPFTGNGKGSDTL